MVLGIFQESLMEALAEEFGEDLEDLDEEAIAEVILNAIPKLALRFGDSLQSSSEEMLKERRNQFESFTQRNIKRWSNSLSTLEKFIVICTEVGEEYNKNKRSEIVESNDIRLDLLIRHHARACHISNEILCLLKNGFADAAHARWRALHEVNVTGMFLAKYDNDLAEKFYLHEYVESYDRMKEHKKYEHLLRAKGVSEGVLEEYRLHRNGFVERFGTGFKHHYGWAANIFPEREPRTIGFAALEKDVGLEHMRPYYRWASENIHAGSKGTRNRLGLDECVEEVLLVGQSNSGLVEPGDSTALSLMQITSVLLKEDATLDSLVLMNLLQTYYEEIGSIFLRELNAPKP